MPRLGKKIKVYDLNLQAQRSPIGVSAIPGITFPATTMKCGVDSDLKSNVIVFSLGSSSPASPDRWIQLDGPFLGPVTLTYTAVRGDYPGKIAVDGVPEDLAAPEQVGDDVLLVQTSRDGIYWKTVRTGTVAELSNEVYTTISVNVYGDSGYKIRIAQKNQFNASEDEYAISVITVSQGEISGYLNNPPRILLQDNDNRTGSYPTVARTGDPNFTGRANVRFNDQQTVEYFSSYPEAEITFLDIPLDAHSISLTGSAEDPSENVKKLFEFQKGVLQYYNESILVDIKGKQTPRSVAYAFAKTVNSASMGIKATPVGEKVKLRQHRPLIPSNGLNITTSSYPAFFLPASIKQFTQHGPENYAYPMILPVPGRNDYASGSTHVNALVASPNITGSLTAPAIMGTSNSGPGIHFTPGENIGPFDESRIYIDNDLSFYTEGTTVNGTTLPGFGERLGSKVSLSFDISTNEPCSVYFSTGTVSPGGTHASRADALAAGVNSGIAYYNFAESKWEIVGDLLTGSNVDIFNSNPQTVADSMLAIMPSQYDYWSYHTAPLTNMLKHQGSPTEFAGFPLASKFDPSEAQLLDMSDYITAPFLLEKLELTVSASYAMTQVMTDINGVHNASFMLLLQRDAVPSGSFTSELTLLKNNGSNTLTDMTWLAPKKKTFETHKDRKIIWYGRIGRYLEFDHPTQTYSSLEEFRIRAPHVFAACDLWIPQLNPYGNNQYPSTGSFTLRGSPNTPIGCGVSNNVVRPRGTRTSAHADIPEYAVIGRKTGGRDLINIADGRSFISSIAGAKEVGTHYVGYEANSAGSRFVPLYEKDSSESPFLLLPTDKLMLVHVNQKMPNPNDDVLTWSKGEDQVVQKRSTLLPGKSKLTLFGSMVREGKAANTTTLNQPLTSDAIHEDVRDDISPLGESLCLDQWQVEPVSTYYKSYLDNIVTGSMYNRNNPTQFINPHTPHVRKSQGTTAGTGIVSGRVGSLLSSGSIQRFVRAVDTEQIFYDSTVPNLQEVVDFYQMMTLNILGGFNYLLMSLDTEEWSQGWYIHEASAGSLRFNRSGMFEHIGHLKRSLSPSTAIKRTDGVSGQNARIDGLYLFSSGTLPIYPASMWTGLMETGVNSQFFLIDFKDGQPSTALAGSSPGYRPVMTPQSKYGSSYMLKMLCGIGDFHGMPLNQAAEASPRRGPAAATSVNFGPDPGDWPLDGSGASDVTFYLGPGSTNPEKYICAGSNEGPGSGYQGKFAFDSDPSKTARNFREVVNTYSEHLRVFYGNAGEGITVTLASGSVTDSLSMVGEKAWDQSGPSGTSNWAGTYGGETFSLAADTLLLRGFKYGLYNAVPSSPTAVFRSDTYGQFRDMLEPRLFSAFFNKKKLERPPVVITFTSRAGERGVAPEETNSQNLSNHATSSVPFRDGVSRDRKDIQPDLLPRVELEMFDLKLGSS